MIDNGDGIDISNLNSDEQEITLSGDTLSIENANFVDLSIYRDNLDEQNLSISVYGDSLLIDNGEGISLNNIKDNDWLTDTLTGNMYNLNAGNVGIGTEAPITNLHVQSNDNTFIDTVAIFTSQGSFPAVGINSTNSNQGGGVLVFAKNSNTLGLVGAQNTANDTSMFFQIGDPGDPQSNNGNNNPEFSLQYRLRSGIPYKRAEMSSDSTSGIDVEDYNNYSRISLRADTINLSGKDVYGYSGGTMWYNPAKVFVHGNMNVYDTAEVSNLKVSNYLFPNYGPPSQINGSYDGYQLITDSTGNLVWYNTNGPSLQLLDPIDIDSLSDGYFDYRLNLYLGNEPNNIILSGTDYATDNVALGHDALDDNQDGSKNVAVGSL